MKRLSPFLLLCFTLPLFFYNLGSYSLVDFDEAWYSEIARNILRFHNPLQLFFNGQPYFDHPPLGFNFMALSFSLFGVNELSARLPSAVLGFGCVVLIYLIGKNLFNKYVGLSAAFMLTSSVWFVFRAREADLDSPFLFFFLLSFYVVSKLKSNPKWIYALGLVVALTLQVKSAIGLSILPAIALQVFFVRSKIPIKDVILAILIFALTILPWLATGFLTSGTEFIFRQLAIGIRSGYGSLASNNTLTYLHFAVGKWYYPALTSLPLATLLSFRKPQIIGILLTLAILFFGFLTNSKTEIWHLLPLYPLLFLSLSSVVFLLIPRNNFLRVTVLGAILLIAIYQIYNFRNNIRLTDQGNSNLAEVSLAARGQPGPLYLDSLDFLPLAVFYSQKNVIWVQAASGDFVRPALLLTQNQPVGDQEIAQSGPWRLVMLK